VSSLLIPLPSLFFLPFFFLSFSFFNPRKKEEYKRASSVPGPCKACFSTFPFFSPPSFSSLFFPFFLPTCKKKKKLKKGESSSAMPAASRPTADRPVLFPKTFLFFFFLPVEAYGKKEQCWKASGTRSRTSPWPIAGRFSSFLPSTFFYLPPFFLLLLSFFSFFFFLFFFLPGR